MRTIIRDNYDPTPNEYHETIVVDEAREKRWLFDCDGVYHDITKVNVVSERGDSEEYAASQKWVTDEVEALEAADQALQDNIDAEEAARIAADEALQDNIDAEEADRIAADTEIWDEIEAIEAASDVVDIVGTYAELQQYDTSKLQDNDIIKVLADETHDDAIAYYRWNKTSSQFAFIGVEGPYYTASETDTLLATKQDKLIAGTNVQIAADGKTISATDTTYTAGTNVSIDANNVISATDTTYSDFTGATASAAGAHGLVPAPAAGDEDKYLKADGTWSTVQSGGTVTVLYQSPSQSTPNTFYKDTTYTDTYTIEEAVAAFEAGKVYVVDRWDQMVEVVYALRSSGNGRLRINRSNGVLNEFEGALSGTTYTTYTQTLQDTIQAGNHITITGGGKTINATFNDFTGATSSVAGANGLVPAPAAGDEGKYLAGDGTWKDAGGGAVFFYADPNDIHDNTYTRYHLYKDSSLTTVATVAEFVSAFTTKGACIVAGSQVFYVAYGWDNDTSSWAVTDELFFELHTADVFIEIGNDYNTTDEFYTSEKNYVQHQLTAGSNISISGDYTISATDTTYTAGSGIAISAQNVISASPNNISSNDWTALWQ